MQDNLLLTGAKIRKAEMGLKKSLKVNRHGSSPEKIF